MRLNILALAAAAVVGLAGPAYAEKVQIDPAYNAVADSQLDNDLQALLALQPSLGPTTRAASVPVTQATDGGQATASVAINISTATTTKIISASGSKLTYISHFDLIAAASDNVTWEYGTGTNCGTGTTILTGAYNLAANGGISAGNGAAPILFVPASQDVCLVTTQAVQLSGAASYAQS